MNHGVELRAGDWVRVRSKEEILKSLDKTGRLDGLVFMPEMFAFCGKRFQVFKRAHKTCDPPNGMGGRRMPRAVHLVGLRCNGEAHGGCQARCLIFWKDAWLEKLKAEHRPRPTGPSRGASGCTEEDVVRSAVREGQAASPDEPTFACQSTHLSQATTPISSWDIRQYIEDYTSGNVRLRQLASTLLLFVLCQIESAGLGLGSAVRWLHDGIQKLRGGTPYPWRTGRIPRGARTPSLALDVQPGELVKIRNHAEILATVNEDGNNRGMSFDPEMVPYCGGTFRVLDRVTRIINEKTGKMQELKNDCIMLDEVVCRACYSKHRRFCPRSIYPYWREVWLDRVTPASPANSRP